MIMVALLNNFSLINIEVQIYTNMETMNIQLARVAALTGVKL